MKTIKLILLFVFIFDVSFTHATETNEPLTIYVHDTKSLFEAIKTTNKRQGYTKIVLAKGRYQIKKSIRLRFEHTTLISKSNNYKDVIIEGLGMIPSKIVRNLIDVSASFIEVTGITLANTSHHLIQVHGKKNADHFKLTNSYLKDSYQQLLKVTSGKGKNIDTADFGIIKNNIFEYSQGVGPNYYIGGIDAHNANNWLVEHNFFQNIASPKDRISEFAVHFWDGSSDNVIKSNTILNCDRGIGFGMKRKKLTSGGYIDDNIIIHNNTKHKFADVGISLLNSSDTTIQNNTIFLFSGYPNAIEYRFKKTRNVIIKNNTVNKKITKRNNASAKLVDNNIIEINSYDVSSIISTWFR